VVINVLAGVLLIGWLVAWMRWPVYQPELIAGAAVLSVAYIFYELVRKNREGA
jgi:asparagine N-glycosylation enzyme membrane subunit Stt3